MAIENVRAAAERVTFTHRDGEGFTATLWLSRSELEAMLAKMDEARKFISAVRLADRRVVLTPRAARACKAYTLAKCLAMYQRNKDGDGARTIGFEYGMTTQQADAAINAGREYTIFTTGKE